MAALADRPGRPRPVGVEEAGQPAALTADVDLAAYRIAQEALTNSARHSAGTKAIVRGTYREDAVLIEVDDDGATRPPARPADPGAVGGSGGPGGPGGSGSSGNGIAGMTERAAALGGTLEAGPRPGGGFRVRAWLPRHGGGR